MRAEEVHIACLGDVAEEGVRGVGAPEGADEVLQHDLRLGHGLLEPRCERRRAA